MRRTLGLLQGLSLVPALLACPSFAPAAPNNRSVVLQVDARQASRGVIRVKEHIPAHGSSLDLYYPKWTPGDHSPDGPIQNVAEMKFYANGRLLTWRRDPVEMFRFRVDVPSGAHEIEAAFTFLFVPDAGILSKVGRLHWGNLLLSPVGPASDIPVRATLQLPAGWRQACALPGAALAPDTFAYPTVSFERLQDSPVLFGKRLESTFLGSVKGAPVRLALTADQKFSDLPDYAQKGLRQIPVQMDRLFRSRPFRHYDFLMTLTDGGAGLEHHESSEDDLPPGDLRDDPLHVGSLFTHEMFHAWNGKYRRPKALATPDFLTPMHGELLWVYEGLTTYYGYVLGARSGITTVEQVADLLASYETTLGSAKGRTWRSVADTAVSAQLTYGTPATWQREIRRTDFYYEGMLTWLEADCIIRKGTAGKRSLDDFCRLFLGGATGIPAVSPYVEDDVYSALRRTYPFDWKKLFRTRLYRPDPGRPDRGIRLAGYEVTYSNKPNWQRSASYTNSYAYRRCGVAVGDGGSVSDIDPEGVAYRAGLNVGDRIQQVNGQPFSLDALHKAIAETTGMLILKVQQGDGIVRELHLPNAPQPVVPHLCRTAGMRDLLSQILSPLKG